MLVDVTCESCDNEGSVNIEDEDYYEGSQHKYMCNCGATTYFQVNYEPVSHNLYCN